MYKTTRISRAENLHAIPPGDPDWDQLFGLRNPTETLNNRFKETFYGKRRRSPAVGARRTLFDLICLALYQNFVSYLAQADRLKREAA